MTAQPIRQATTIQRGLDEHCAADLIKSYKAAGCKDSAVGYYECVFPVCDENDLPDWPTDCPAFCNVG